jgi:hypothetical protein
MENRRLYVLVQPTDGAAVLTHPGPAITRSEVAGMLSRASRTQVGGTHSIQRVLVSAQIALDIVLLAGSGLLIRSLSRLGQVSLGLPTRAHARAFRISELGETNNRFGLAQRLYRTLETL